MRDASVATRRHMPGEHGAWIFIFGDMIIFAIFFVTFIWYRAQSDTLYDRSQLMLDQRFGLLNTVLLLTSSWFVAMAVRAYRHERRDLCLRLIPPAMVLGVGFLVSKVFEWGNKFSQGITILTNEFFMFYFMFTGIHLLHVLIGVGVLTYLFLHIRSAPAPEQGMSILESGGAFWHLVDLLWVVLFALLYLMR